VTEADIQKAVFSHLRTRAMPDAVFWAVHNSPGARRMAGYLEGVHDVHIWHRGNFFTLELKTENGRPTEAQLKFRDRINGTGGYSMVVHGLDRALRCLVDWGVLKPEHNHNGGEKHL
jgi:hypothetical protein